MQSVDAIFFKKYFSTQINGLQHTCLPDGQICLHHYVLEPRHQRSGGEWLSLPKGSALSASV